MFKKINSIIGLQGDSALEVCKERMLMAGQGEDKRFPTTLRCQHCGSENTIPIRYGYPSGDKAWLDALRKGEIEMGGCCIVEGMPTYHCKDCGRDSGHLRPPSTGLVG